MKQDVLIADLDGTLAASKASITESMAAALCAFLSRGGTLAIITGGLQSQIVEQLGQKLSCIECKSHMYILPTSGSKLFRWNQAAEDWDEVYNHSLRPEEKAKIASALEYVVSQKLVDLPAETWGPQLEDRDSQMSFSALGQEAPLSEKQVWDPDRKKRAIMVAELEKHIPEFEIRIGGSTTIDITRKGIDKEFGIKEFLTYAKIDKDQVLFIGDALEPGGNDYPATRVGIKTIDVSGPEEAEKIIGEM